MLIKTQLSFISRTVPQEDITLNQEWDHNLWNRSSFANEKEC